MSGTHNTFRNGIDEKGVWIVVVPVWVMGSWEPLPTTMWSLPRYSVRLPRLWASAVMWFVAPVLGKHCWSEEPMDIAAKARHINRGRLLEYKGWTFENTVKHYDLAGCSNSSSKQSWLERLESDGSEPRMLDAWLFERPALRARPWLLVLELETRPRPRKRLFWARKAVEWTCVCDCWFACSRRDSNWSKR